MLNNGADRFGVFDGILSAFESRLHEALRRIRIPRDEIIGRDRYIAIKVDAAYGASLAKVLLKSLHSINLTLAPDMARSPSTWNC